MEPRSEFKKTMLSSPTCVFFQGAFGTCAEGSLSKVGIFSAGDATGSHHVPQLPEVLWEGVGVAAHSQGARTLNVHDTAHTGLAAGMRAAQDSPLTFLPMSMPTYLSSHIHADMRA